MLLFLATSKNALFVEALDRAASINRFLDEAGSRAIFKNRYKYSAVKLITFSNEVR